jgi:hypothetical protein
MPKQMQYVSQAIVFIASDLEENARALQMKREAAGDTTVEFADLAPVAQSIVLQGPLIGTLPLAYRQPDSRLIILGHGDEDSTFIATAEQGGSTYTPLQFTEVVRGWLGANSGYVPMKVRRISLHMCYGGGNRGNARGNTIDRAFFEQFTKLPNKSFAYKFASMAGELADDITARTDDVAMSVYSRGDQFETARREVGGRHKGFGDKFVFVTNPRATIKNPVKPTVRLPG